MGRPDSPVHLGGARALGPISLRDEDLNLRFSCPIDVMFNLVAIGAEDNALGNFV
jgi:hypothetical protein